MGQCDLEKGKVRKECFIMKPYSNKSKMTISKIYKLTLCAMKKLFLNVHFNYKEASIVRYITVVGCGNYF